MDFNFVTPGITVFIYFVAEFLKKMVLKEDNQRKWLPFICAMIGIVMAITIYFVYPKGSMASNVIEAFATGALSGFAATGFNQLFKQFSRYSGNMMFDEPMPGACVPAVNVGNDYSRSNTELSQSNSNNTTINNTTINNTINYGNEDSEDQSENV